MHATKTVEREGTMNWYYIKRSYNAEIRPKSKNNSLTSKTYKNLMISTCGILVFIGCTTETRCSVNYHN